MQVEPTLLPEPMWPRVAEMEISWRSNGPVLGTGVRGLLVNQSLLIKSVAAREGVFFLSFKREKMGLIVLIHLYCYYQNTPRFCSHAFRDTGTGSGKDWRFDAWWSTFESHFLHTGWVTSLNLHMPRYRLKIIMPNSLDSWEDEMNWGSLCFLKVTPKM